MKKLLVCTFSGGRTSAFMGQFLLNYPKYKDFEKVFIFANTGKENPKTLDFIDRCDKEWGLGVVWLEANVQEEKGVGTTYKIVEYETASRTGKPFEDMLNKYPMPTAMASNCTRELKLAPINKYVKSLGYDEVYTAMGIRKDEEHRRSNFADRDNLIYPLMDDIQVDSKFVRYWWDKQDFDLELKDYEGNCDLCFKKSNRKKLTILKENPELGEWWLEMEQKHSTESIPRFDLRTHHTIEDLINMSKRPFRSVQDAHEIDKTQCSIFDINMDMETDCMCKST